jgi:hypothetical protein
MATGLTEERLRRLYELLDDLLDERDEGRAEDESPWYEPSPPPLASGANLSATDLLSWWFRPPSGKKGNAWDTYFGDSRLAPGAPVDVQEVEPKPDTSAASQIVSKSVWQALIPETEDRLASEDAEAAVEVFYQFLHAFGRGDIEGALQWVSEDYHVIEDDQESDRNGLRCRLESLLDSLHGWEIEVSLSAPPEPLAHPYGIVIYAEIQIDGTKPGAMAARSQVEHRLVLLEKAGEAGWKIVALSRPRI